MHRIALPIAMLLAATSGWAAADFVVSQKNKIFDPGEVELRPGESLRIANDDRVMHHVYIESAGFDFDSGEQPPGRTIAIRFDRRGEFEALCAIHPKMKLKVKVL